jgi:hypothetical protein
MSKQDLVKLDKQVLINKYIELHNKYLNILAEYSVLEARYEQEHNMCEMLIEKDRIKVLKKER